MPQGPASSASAELAEKLLAEQGAEKVLADSAAAAADATDYEPVSPTTGEKKVMKKQTTVAGSKHKPPYNVFDFYKDEGPVQRLAKHPYFEYLTLFVISFNACWIGVDTDWNKAEE